MGFSAFHATGNILFAVLGLAVVIIYGWWLWALLRSEQVDRLWTLIAGIVLLYLVLAPATAVIGVSSILESGPVMVFEGSAFWSIAFWLVTRGGLIAATLVVIFTYMAAQPGIDRRQTLLVGCGAFAATCLVWLAFGAMVF